MSQTDIEQRYRFLLAFLIEKGVLTNQRYSNGTWVLRGVYGVDDSGIKGAGLMPEQAIDNANRELSFDYDNTKVIRTDLYDDRYHDWGAIGARYPKAKTIVQTRTDHVPNGKRSILFNFFRGEADSLTTTLKYEF